MMPRYSNNGSVYDRQPPLNFMIVTFYISAYFTSLFNWIIDKLCIMVSKKGFPNPPASLGTIATAKPPSVAVAPPLIATELYPHFESGFCEGVPEVSRILGPKSIELKNGRVLENIDTIIYCTGYHSTIPVQLSPSELNPYPYPGASPTLYRNIFPLHPDPSIRNTLAFLGQCAIPAAGFSPHEQISLAISQIWLGNSHLPPLPEIQKWFNRYMTWRQRTAKQYSAQSTFYTMFVPIADHVAWLDATAGLGLRARFGLMSRWVNPKAWGFWWRDRKLFYLCLNGVISPAIFRLFDAGKRKAWAGAARQIVVDNERVKRQQRGG